MARLVRPTRLLRSAIVLKPSTLLGFAKSIPQELERIVPDNPSLPVQPLILSSQDEYSMFKDFLVYPWVLMPYRYESLEELLASLEDKVIAPAINKAREIENRRKEIERAMSK